MASLDHTQFAGITAAGLGALSPNRFADLVGTDSVRVGLLTATQVDALTQEQVGVLGVRVASLNAEAMASLDNKQFVTAALLGALSPTQFIALMGTDSVRVGLLTATQVDALTPAQVGALGTRIASLSAEAISSLDNTQFAGITAAGLGALSPTQFTGLMG